MGAALLACSAKPAPVAAASPHAERAISASVGGGGAAPRSTSVATRALASTGSASVEPAPSSAKAELAAAPCPQGMQHVKTAFCPDMKRQCVDKEYDKPNRITICHHYLEGQNECRAPRVPLDYCIDEFEYPDRKGEKPPVMVSFYDAEKACAQQSKRVCRESEWVAACEGPDETPFPYGWRRDAQKCNFDNRWVNPILDRVYAKDPEIQRAELLRLDRSLPSGERPECKSGFGVFDLTGNVDEWVRADQDRTSRRSRFAGLKGGAWGHVRNACRPVTTSHPPDFKYYFISFRCCADATVGAAGANEAQQSAATGDENEAP